jgi:hypothetical protein
MGKKSKKQKEGGKRSTTPTDGKELTKQQKKHLMELVTQLLQSNAYIQYSETSLNWPALGPKNMASLEGWPVL